MNQERDLDRTHQTPHAAAAADHDVAPGRATRSSQLLAPTHPMVGGILMRKAERDDNGVAAGADLAVASAASSSGNSLPEPIMRKFESSLGADLSSVRVHTGGESAAAAHAVGARAYTTGQDIHFGAGQYDPHSEGGQHLLAHEVAHTVQQQGGAPHRQNKLEVSSPGDHAEHEADRAADAMVTGAPTQIASANGFARKVFRDPTPTTPTVTTTTPQAGTGANTSNDDKSTLTWMLDWVNKETGKTVQSTSNARTGKDAAQGTLKVTPEQGGGDVRTMPWVNAATSGEVTVGTTQQTKGKGGNVSSDISWGAPPSAQAQVRVEETQDDPKKVGQSQLAAKQKLASAAAANVLNTELQTSGQLAEIQQHMLEAAKTAVGSGGPGYSYDLSVLVNPMKLDPVGGNSRGVTTGAYSGPSGSAEQRHVNIEVETKKQELKGTASAEQTNSNSSHNASQDNQHDANQKSDVDSKTTDNYSNTQTSVEVLVMSAFDQFTSKITKTNLSAEGSLDGAIAAQTSASAKLENLKIDLGALIKASGLLFPEIAPALWVISKAFGSGVVGGAFSAAFQGSLSGHLAGKAEWSDEDINKAKTALRTSVATTVKTQVTSSIKTLKESKSAEQHETNKANQKDDAKGEVKKSTATTETIGVKYIIGEPKLTVK